MDAKKLIKAIVGNIDLEDSQILKIWYSATVAVNEFPHNQAEDMFVRMKLDNEKLKLIAAINIYDVIKSMPLMVADLENFKKKTHRLEPRMVAIMVLTIKSEVKGKGKKEKSFAYNEFCRKVKGVGLSNTVTKSEFDIIVDTVMVWKYGVSAADRLKISNEIFDAFSLMRGELCMTKDKMHEFCLACYDNCSIEDLIEDHLEGQFSRSENNEIKKIWSATKKAVLSVSPLQCIQLTEVAKVNHYYSVSLDGALQKNSTIQTMKKTRYPLEHAFLIRLLRSVMSIDDNGEIILVDTTPFYVEDVLSKAIGSYNVRIACRTTLEKELYKRHYTDPKYCVLPYENVEYEVGADWLSNYEGISTDTVAIISQNTYSLSEIYMIAKMIEKKGAGTIILMGEDSTIKKVVEKSKMGFEAILLPALYDMPTGYQSVVILSATIKTNKIHKLKKVKNEENIQLLELAESAEVTKELLEEAKTLRTYSQQTKKRNVRRSAEEFRASDEVSIYISRQPNTSAGNPKVHAYIKVDGKQLKESIAAFRNNGKLNNTNDVVNKYLDHTVKRKTRDVKIKELIKELIIERYSGQGISLQTVWLLEDDIKSHFNKKELGVIEQLMDGDVGKMNADHYDIGEFKDEIRKTYQNKEMQIEALELVVQLADISTQKGFTRKSIDCEELYAMQYEYGRRNIRDKLIGESLALERAKMAYAIIMRVDNKSLRMALKLRLLMGLEADVICALDVGDLIVNETYGFNQLRIIKKLNAAGDIESVKRDPQKRVVPLTARITEELHELTKQKERNDPIFQINGERLTPQRIKSETRNIMRAIGLENEFIEIWDNNKKVKKMDVSLMAKDTLRGTMSYIGKYYAGMMGDEIRYVVGLKPHTTVGKHYIDFTADISQRRILFGLTKIESILTEGGEYN